MRSINYCSIILTVAVVLIVNLSACSAKRNDMKNANDEEVKREEFVTMIGIIKKIDQVDKKITVFNIETKETVTLAADASVDMKDKYGEPIIIEGLNIGDIIKTKYGKDKLIPEYIQITAEIWEHNNVTKVKINTEKNTLQYGSDEYNLTKDTLVLYKNEPISIEEITPIDKVTIKGNKKNAWVIILENGHGTVSLKNHDYFIGGTLELGSNIIEPIDKITSLVVPAGEYKVVIDKENITPIQKEIIVKEGKEIIIDLSTSTPKEAQVLISMNPREANLYINGQKYNELDEFISLSYGQYQFVADKEGYEKYEEIITIDEPIMNISIELEKKYNYLHVDNPKDVEAYVNGDYAGIIPISIPILPGKYTVTLRKVGYIEKEYEIEIPKNQKDNYFKFPELVQMNN